MTPSVDLDAYRRVDPLFVGTSATITDITCTCPRSPSGAERHSTAYQLIFVRAGVFVKHESTMQRRALAAQPAHVLLLNRGESYRISHPSSRGDACTVIAYDAASVRAAAAAHSSGTVAAHRTPFPASHAVLAPAVLLRLQRLRLRLRATPGTLPPDEVEAEAQALLHMVLGGAWTKHRESREHSKRRPSRRRHEITEIVKQALARHPAAAASLHDLAAYVGVSPFYLARTFHGEAGLPIHQYLLRLRLGTALERMSDSSARLTAIALDAGFSSLSHFSSAFRKTFGVAPTEWRTATTLQFVRPYSDQCA